MRRSGGVRAHRPPVVGRAHEDARNVQQLAERQDDHQGCHQRQMDEQEGIGGQGLPVEIDEPQGERLDRDDVGMGDVLHAQAGQPDADQQRQHEVIRQPGNVAAALLDEASGPQAAQAGDQPEAGIGADRLDERHPSPYRFGEIAQVSGQHGGQRGVEERAEDPDPLVRMEQAFEEHHLAGDPQNGARPGPGRRRGEHLHGHRQREVGPDLEAEPADENGGRPVEQQRVGNAQERHVSRTPCHGRRLAGERAPAVSEIRCSPSASAGRRSCKPAWPGRTGRARRGTCCCPSRGRRRSSSA